FQCVEESGRSVAGLISDALIVKHQRAAVAGWPCGIKTIVFMDRNVIPARYFASPVIVTANAVGIGGIDRLDQVFAHQVSAIIRAAEAFQRAVFQSDRLKLGKNGLAQPEPARFVHEISNDESAERQSDNEK